MQPSYDTAKPLTSSKMENYSRAKSYFVCRTVLPEPIAFSAHTTVTCLIISLGYLCCWLPVLVFKILNLSYLPSNKSSETLKAKSKNHFSQKCLLGPSSRSHGTNQFNTKSTSLQYHAAQETDPKAGGENSSR